MASQQIQSFRDLDAWNVAMDLAVATYALAARLPMTERFELSAQMRRAATSVPSNIAEGHASGRNGVFLRHVGIALGSLGELSTHLELGRRLKFFNDHEVDAVQEHVRRTRQLLYGLRRSLRRKLLDKAGALLALLAGPTLWQLFPILG